MKQIIFLCLLSLTLCLSKPTEHEAQPQNTLTKVGEEVKVGSTNETSTVATTTQAQTTPTKQPLQPTTTTSANTSASATTNNKNSTDKMADNTETSVRKIDENASVLSNLSTSTQMSTPNTTMKSEEKSPKINETKISTTKLPTSNDTTTTENPKTNVSPKDEDKHIVQARGFDGPSFIGGIILSLGLLAIGFMGFKYYKNQTERNYHTL